MGKVSELLTKERGTPPPDMLSSKGMQWLGLIVFLCMFGLALYTSTPKQDSSGLAVVLLLISLLFLPITKYQQWLKIQYDAIVKLIEALFTGAVTIVLVLVVGGLIFWGGGKLLSKVGDAVTPDKWTLMVCKTKLNDSECYDTSYEIPGFKSARECLLEGASRFQKQGFECGSNCERGGFGSLNVCKEICNSSGCN